MIYCPFCDTGNRSGSKFCNECGAALGEQSLICPHCSSLNPPANRFCRACGHALPELASLASMAVEPAAISAGEEELDDELPSLEADVPTLDAPAPTASERAAADTPTEDLALSVLPAGETTATRGLVQDGLDPAAVEATALPILDEKMRRPSELPAWLDIPEPPPAPRELPNWLLAPEPPPRALPSWLPLQEAPPQRTLPPWLFTPEAPPPPVRSLPDWLFLVEPGVRLPEEPAKALPAWLFPPETETLPPRGATVNGFLGTDCTDSQAIRFNPLPKSVDSNVPPVSRLLPAWLFLPDETPLIERVLPEWLFLPDDSPAPKRFLPAWLDTREPGKPRLLPSWLFAVEETPLPLPVVHSLPSWLFLTDPGEETAMPPSLEAAEAPASPARQTIVLARPFQSPQTPRRASLAAGPEGARAPSYEEVFADILQPKAEVTPSVSLPNGPRRFKLASVILILVVALPLFLPMGINVEPRQDTTRVFDTLQALPPAANVLVAFEWSPGTDEEMAPIAEALVRHLVKRRAKIVAVSLTPEGGKLAQRVLDQTLLGATSYKYGKQIVNLGYRPGGEAAIRSMLVDLPNTYGVDHFGIPVKDLPLVGEVKSLKGADLIVVLAAEPENLLSWITQASSAYQGIRMVAGVSAAALPWTRPFASASQAAQLKGMLVGIRGAAEYELSMGESRLGVAATDAQSLGAIFLALAIAFGNLAHLRARLNKPKLARASQPGPVGR
ncbi:MAG: zinc ribbon domain-containing protein [Chloroflexi bacterium]|nr:zinc ribbon domain-containing protein [Chloroflexota bacterium]